MPSARGSVDQRAAMANALHPDAIVSIHADGGPPTAAGFTSELFGPPLQRRPGRARQCGWRK